MSQYDNNRREGKDFLGYCLQLQGSLSKNFREYPITGNKGKSKSLTNHQISGQQQNYRQQERSVGNCEDASGRNGNKNGFLGTISRVSADTSKGVVLCEKRRNTGVKELC